MFALLLPEERRLEQGSWYRWNSPHCSVSACLDPAFDTRMQRQGYQYSQEFTRLFRVLVPTTVHLEIQIP